MSGYPVERPEQFGLQADETLWVETEDTLFSPRHLDRGTELMLQQLPVQIGQKVLDLGCGNGPVALILGKRGAEVLALDIDPKAVEQTRRNLEQADLLHRCSVQQSDALSVLRTESGRLQEQFDWILANPPYHTDFSVAKRMIEESFYALHPGGSLRIVVRRKLWYQNKLRGVFGGCTVREEDGYSVLQAQKRERRPQNRIRRRSNKAKG